MSNQLQSINYSEELGEDLIKYLTVYIDEVDKILKSSSDKREAISLLSQKLSNQDLKDLEEPSDELKSLFADETKKKEALSRLQESLAEEIKQFAMLDNIIRSLFDEVSRRIVVK